MTTAEKAAVAGEDFADVDALSAWLNERHIKGAWQSFPRPAVEFEPFLWKWADIYRGITTAADLVPMEQLTRRTVQLLNPSAEFGMANTIHISIQCIKPGERAIAHRHLAAAFRFIVKGAPGACSVVQGEPLPMEAGDLLTTPSLSYHDHHNGGDVPVVWLDGLDSRIASLGKPMGNENYPARQQPIEHPIGYSNATLANVRPTNYATQLRTPPYRYPWAETQSAFDALVAAGVEPDPWDGHRLMYTHPLTGGPTMPTVACEQQLLPAGMATKAQRRNSTVIYHAFRGEGVTTIDGEEFAWSEGDIFVVPPWRWYAHQCGDAGAILFSMHDWPALDALGLYSEERAGD